MYGRTVDIGRLMAPEGLARVGMFDKVAEGWRWGAVSRLAMKSLVLVSGVKRFEALTGMQFPNPPLSARRNSPTTRTPTIVKSVYYPVGPFQSLPDSPGARLC
jgi:hypothetical protein